MWRRQQFLREKKWWNDVLTWYFTLHKMLEFKFNVKYLGISDKLH